MTNQNDSDHSEFKTGSHETAEQLAEHIAPLLRRARASGHDLLAYLLAMALNEARRLSEM